MIPTLEEDMYILMHSLMYRSAIKVSLTFEA